MSLNKVQLIGYLGRDAALSKTPRNVPVAALQLATSDTWADDTGARKTRLEWHRVLVWGKQALALQRYLVKGKVLYIEGRLHTRTWTEADNVTRTATEIHADRVELLGADARRRGDGEHVSDEDVARGDTPVIGDRG